MAEILELNADNAKIGSDSGSTKKIPIASIRYANPKVGDKVKVYKEGTGVIVTLDSSANMSHGGAGTSNDRRQISKIAYILITFFLGWLGIHRFMRGQVGIGILMLLFNWLTFGIWWLIDFIISLVKLSAYTEDYYTFTPDGRWVR